MAFNPQNTYENMEEFGYSFCLSQEFDPNHPMGNVGDFDFIRVLEASLVNLQDKFKPILNRAIEWIRYGIEVNEGVGENYRQQPLFSQTRLHQSLALALWFRDGIDHIELWDQVLQLHALSLEDEHNPYGTIDMKTMQVNDWVLRCLQAEQYEQGIEGYRRYHGDGALSIKTIKSERKLAYAYCLHYAEGKYSSDELFHAARKLLNTKMDADWLSKGQADRALLWLKTVYWNRQQNLTPLQVWLKAYDHMPHVAPFDINKNRQKKHGLAWLFSMLRDKTRRK